MIKLQLSGQVFGRLTVQDHYEIDKRGRTSWLCLCTCGKQKLISSASLRSGNTKSCGCLHVESSIAKCKTRKTHEYESAFHDLYTRYRRNAFTRGLSFDLSHEEFYRLTNQNCYYCGITPQQVMTKAHYVSQYIYNGIDRVDNSQGYFLDNCVACCGTCNKAKLAMTREEFLSWIKKVYEHNF
jgi:hypothetical protein